MVSPQRSALHSTRSFSQPRGGRWGLAASVTREIEPRDSAWLHKADFKGGKPGDKALHETCFPCHTPAKGDVQTQPMVTIATLENQELMP